MECYSAIKRNAFESVLTRWLNLEPMTQSEISQKNEYCINAYIWNLKDGTYFQGSSGDADIENRPMDGEGGKERVGRMERVAQKHRH